MGLTAVEAAGKVACLPLGRKGTMSRRLAVPFFVLFLFVTVTASADLGLRLDATGAAVTGATPGKSVVIYGFAHQEENYSGTIVRYEEILTSDGFGAAVWPMERISNRSLWFAVDVSTGQIAVTTPEGFPLRRLETPAELVSRKDLAARLELPFAYSEVLLVRPEAGAWIQSANRGGSHDLKVKRGVLTVEPRSFRKMKGAEPGPPKIEKGDVIVVIDPYALTFVTERWK
jgi:hypothetical protein